MTQPEPDRTTWTITQLAEEHGVTLRTLRHYEDVGLLTPERRGTVRVFHPRDRVRLQLILRGKRLGFTLPEMFVTGVPLVSVEATGSPTGSSSSSAPSRARRSIPPAPSVPRSPPAVSRPNSARPSTTGLCDW